MNRRLILAIALMMGLGLSACGRTPSRSRSSSGEPSSSMVSSQKEGDPKTSEESTTPGSVSEEDDSSSDEQTISDETGGDSSDEIISSEDETSDESSELVVSEESSAVGDSSEESSESTEVISEVSEESEESVQNDGTFEHPFTVSEGYAIAETLGANEDAGAQYFTTGVVTGTVSFYKGRLSFDFTDGEHTLRVYNMNNEENKASYKDGEYDIKEGDTLIVAGTYKNYVKNNVSTLEICYVKDVADCYRAG